MEGQSYGPKKEEAFAAPDTNVEKPGPDKSENSSPKSGEVNEEDLALKWAKEDADARIQHVMEAANREDPLERLYELRQEVKDNNVSQGATPIGTIVTDAVDNQTLPPPPPPSPMTQATPVATTDPYPEPKPTFPSLYRLAVIWGFIVAVIIIVIAVLGRLLIG